MQVRQTWRVGVLALVPFTVCAQSEQSLAQCAAMMGDSERLACYDEHAISLGIELAALVALEPGLLTVSAEPAAVGDPSNVTVTTNAISGTSSEGDVISMVIRCRRNETDLYIRWQDYLGSWAYVRTRVGDNDIGTRQWNLSTDGRTTFYPRRAEDFIEDVIAAGRVEFEITPYVKTAVTAVFDASELGEAIGPLREACEW